MALYLEELNNHLLGNGWTLEIKEIKDSDTRYSWMWAGGGGIWEGDAHILLRLEPPVEVNSTYSAESYLLEDKGKLILKIYKAADHKYTGEFAIEDVCWMVRDSVLQSYLEDTIGMIMVSWCVSEHLSES